MSSYIILDLEMCRTPKGTKRGDLFLKNELIQIGAVLLNDNFEEVDTFMTYVSPQYSRITPVIQKLTGITQNISDCLLNETARGMLSNSEFLLMLNQSPSDRKDLSELLNISDTQMSYITNAGAGRGLIKVGGSIVPFVNDFPTDTQLYKLMSTKPGEG